MVGDTSSPPMTIAQLMRRLIARMSPRRKRQFALLLVLMVLASFAELLSIGAVLPFLAALTQPAIVFRNPWAHKALDFVCVTTDSQLTTLLTAIFVLATVFACIVRSALLWSSTRLSFAFGSDLSNTLYRSVLGQPYSVHVARNSSEVVDAIWGKVSEVIFYVLLPSMNLVISVVIALCICGVLAWALPSTALLALAVVVAVYAIVIKFSRQRLRMNSTRIANGSTAVVKTLQEGLGGIRDILIDGSRDHFVSVYRDTNATLRRAQGENQIISLGPRYLLEAMGMLLIAALAYALATRANGMVAAIPLLGAVALGLQRLLPAAQLIYGSWSTIAGAQSSLQGVLDMLDESPAEDDATEAATPALPFRTAFRLCDLSFGHTPGGRVLFERVDLTVAKGSHVGIVGVTGSGKTTLLDIVMGLLHPTTGHLEVDGVPVTAANRRAWQKHIAHVPQSVFLADASLMENIAFGIPTAQIDQERVRRAAAQAQLAELVESWPQGYETRLGERGVQLSGGQRQRIGIARALYKDADVIVFDEATSALDSETEKSVMSAIEGLSEGITILIIAHRLNTLSRCSDIIEVSNGQVRRRKSLDELSASPAA